ncbi:glycoside hydrolase family 16 protein [Sinomicrobium sp.]
MKPELLFKQIYLSVGRLMILPFIVIVVFAIGCEEPSFERNEKLSGKDAITLTSPIPGYTLVWEDNFDGSALDSIRWRYRTDCKSQSCQRPENVMVDNDTLKILLKEESYQNKPFTGGGIITKQPDSYGYYEISAKMDDGFGWHESFWAVGRSGFDDPNPIYADSTGARIEIDCFEHYGDFANNVFRYGAIDWSTLRGTSSSKGSIGAGVHQVSSDLSQGFHTYGFEYTPDYINFFFDGDILKTIDIRSAPQHDIYLWITSIATEVGATDGGAMAVDYVRAYNISPAQYDIRKVEFLQYLDSLRGPQESEGIDLWIESEDFVNINNWTVERDIDHTVAVKGFSSFDATRDSTDLTARTAVEVETSGVYRLWVRSRDFDTQQGVRKFKVIVNGESSPTEFGTHGEVGYEWQSGGDFTLEEGINILDIYDSSQYFARCDRLLLTTDLTFQPEGIGGFQNVSHINP